MLLCVLTPFVVCVFTTCVCVHNMCVCVEMVLAISSMHKVCVFSRCVCVFTTCVYVWKWSLLSLPCTRCMCVFTRCLCVCVHNVCVSSLLDVFTNSFLRTQMGYTQKCVCGCSHGVCVCVLCWMCSLTLPRAPRWDTHIEISNLTTGYWTAAAT